MSVGDGGERMRALVREAGGTVLREVSRPRPARPDDVLIRVEAAGICRTDLYVADGRLPVAEPRILGHEFSGVVHAAGPAASLRTGDHVAALPWLGCGTCAECRHQPSRPYRCSEASMLGVDVDGAFAEWVVLPEAALFRLPAALPFTAGAYLEPIAASLAVLQAELPRKGRGLVYGENRIARLTHQVLLAAGFPEVVLVDPATLDQALEPSSFEWAVETVATEEALSVLVTALRPGGTLVLKSRPCAPVPLDVRGCVLKELTLRAVGYAPFAEAAAWLAEGRLEFESLLGPSYPLTAWEAAFSAAAREGCKVFLTPRSSAPD